MLGGVKITQQTREHAREMLEQARASRTKTRRRNRAEDSPQRSGSI
jgi:hypothetical protein